MNVSPRSPLWQVAKALHTQDVVEYGHTPGDGSFPKFKNLPAWAQNRYFRMAKKAVRAYQKATS